MNTSILVIFALSNKFGARNSHPQFLSQWKGCFSLSCQLLVLVNRAMEFHSRCCLTESPSPQPLAPLPLPKLGEGEGLGERAKLESHFYYPSTYDLQSYNRFRL